MFPEPFERLIQELQKLPTIGPKTAQRLAFHILNKSQGQVESLAKSLVDVKRLLGFCKKCGNISSEELCKICQDPKRQTKTICVVATPRDLMSIELTGEYKGLYHVLGGLISPLDGVGPDDLRLDSLFQRTLDENFEEIIVATNPTIPGEATALYIRQQMPGEVKITRLALGLPMGSDLEYIDGLTLSKALSFRRSM